MNKKTLIICACCNRKRSDGGKNLRWRKEQSIISTLSSEAGQKLLKSRWKLARRFQQVEGKDLGGDNHAPALLMPAFKRYDGNLYRKITGAHWEKLAQTDHVEIIIVSALYGLLIPWEAIREYNLTMATAVVRRLKLSRWWIKEEIGHHLKEYILRNQITDVYNFLSSSYSLIAEPLASLKHHVRIHPQKKYHTMGADHHRGRDINNLLAQLLN